MVLGSLAITIVPATASDQPVRVGDCVQTRITLVAQRLVDGDKPVPDSGSAVSFANGLYQVSYDEVPGIQQSHIGDPVRICLVALPKGCPPGDDRGKMYRTTNLRSRMSWTLADAEHMCGGA